MKLVKSTELCQILDCSRATLSQYRRMGLPYLKIGPKMCWYDLEEVRAWMKRNARREVQR